MTDAERLSGVRGVLLDLDGTVYEAGRLIPGARQAVEVIRRAGLPLRFATNTTRRPRSALVEQLATLGIDANASDVVTAPRAAAAWLAARGVRRLAFHMAGDTLQEFSDFTVDDEAPEAVVVGDLGPGWTFDRLNRAFRQVHGGARLVAMQKNRYWRTADGLTLDAGPFVAALEYATGRQATVCGKPSAAFFAGAADSMGLALSAVVVVGDDVASDVRGAIAAGARGVLVRTGKYREGDLDEPGRAPDGVIDSIADLARLLGLSGMDHHPPLQVG